MSAIIVVVSHTSPFYYGMVFGSFGNSVTMAFFDNFQKNRNNSSLQQPGNIVLKKVIQQQTSSHANSDGILYELMKEWVKYE